jgi:hypothetical protein
MTEDEARRILQAAYDLALRRGWNPIRIYREGEAASGSESGTSEAEQKSLETRSGRLEPSRR